MKSLGLYLFLLGISLLVSCSTSPVSPTPNIPATQAAETNSSIGLTAPTSTRPAETISNLPTETAVDTSLNPSTQTPSADTVDTLFADVHSVDVNGDENTYQFTVEIRSPDTGCEQYADWWEVVSQDGDLLYRRILLHSHVSEQPFKRSGGPVSIDAETVVIVRAHMHPHGYGGTVLQGSVAGGFSAVQLEPDFAAGIELVDPLPTGCAF